MRERCGGGCGVGAGRGMRGRVRGGWWGGAWEGAWEGAVVHDGRLVEDSGRIESGHVAISFLCVFDCF